MTRNNLGEHLSWILATKASLPLQSSPLEILVLSQSSAARASGTQQSAPSFTATAFQSTSKRDATEWEGVTQFLRPAVPPREQKRLAPDAMVRLQSGPKSSTKSRLLSHATPLEVNTPGSQVPRVLGSSLRDQYHAAFDRTESCMYTTQKELKSRLMSGQCLPLQYPKPRLREKSFSLLIPETQNLLRSYVVRVMHG